MRMKIITIHTIKKRMCIISDIKIESDIKDADNEENTVDPPVNSLFHVFYNCF